MRAFVKETYIDAVINRERMYSTGLPTKGISVAIPHTDSSHVEKSAVAVAVLDKPVKFGLMGGEDNKEIDAKIVFLLAISDPKAQIELLKKLMKLFQNIEMLEKIASANSEEKIYDYLTRALKNGKREV